jgi:hypothetical protein
MAVIRAKSARKASGVVGGDKKAYWLGTLPDSPKHNVTLAGITFPRYTQSVTEIPGTNKTQYEVGNTKPGGIWFLTDKQIERIKDDADAQAIRWSKAVEVEYQDAAGHTTKQTIRRGILVSYAAVNEHCPQPSKEIGDEPVAKYLYMEPLGDLKKGFVPSQSTVLPASLWEMMGGDKPDGENKKREAIRDAAEKAADEAELKAKQAVQVTAEMMLKKQG